MDATKTKKIKTKINEIQKLLGGTRQRNNKKRLSGSQDKKRKTKK